jgi:hypothetical protein
LGGIEGVDGTGKGTRLTADLLMAEGEEGKENLGKLTERITGLTA